MIASSDVASASIWLRPSPSVSAGHEQRAAADAEQAGDDPRREAR